MPQNTAHGTCRHDGAGTAAPAVSVVTALTLMLTACFSAPGPAAPDTVDSAPMALAADGPDPESLGEAQIRGEVDRLLREDLGLDSARRVADASGDLWELVNGLALQDTPPDEHGTEVSEDLAEQATDPSAVLTQLKIQNTLALGTHGASGLGNVFTLQPVIPVTFDGAFPPLILRPTINTLVTSTDPDGPQDRVTGFGDISFLGLCKLDADWGAWGFGVAAVFPTATDDLIGSEKWQLGPAGFFIISAIPKVQFGAVIQNLWSYAGDDDRDDVNALLVQPILNIHLEDGWYTGLSDFNVVRDWTNGGWVIPLTWRVGKVTSFGTQPVNLSLAAFYNIVHKQPGPDWGLKFQLTFLFP